ncbi:MAG: RHS repeat-associated core domain-containing protein, partial [Stellaceae bacterium]
LGLYYYRARMYSPALGRFMQPDPIGYRGGANLYAYVGNDPLNQLDSFGLCDQQGHPLGCLRLSGGR